GAGDEPADGAAGPHAKFDMRAANVDDQDVRRVRRLLGGMASGTRALGMGTLGTGRLGTGRHARIVTGIPAPGQADPSQIRRFPQCGVAARADPSPGADAEAAAEGCLETVACPLIAELPPAEVFPADPSLEAVPPKSPLTPRPSPVLSPPPPFR